MSVQKGLGSSNIYLSYGREKLKLPTSNLNLKEILLASEPAPPEDIKKKIRASLSFPIYSEPFKDLFSSNEKILLIVSDITRATGSDIFLPLLIGKLNDCGIPDKNIKILFSLGIHRPLTDDERLALLGKDICSRIKTYNHDAWSDETETAGKTSKGNRISLNKKIFEADKVILTGAINFHYLAGFGGGRKSLLPGVASYDSIILFHLLSLCHGQGKGRHPKASTAILTGNPMEEEMNEVIDMVKPCFLLNTVMNSKKKIVEIFAGDAREAFFKGCIYFLDHYGVKIREKADLVIASCGGFPLDINFIQAHKTLEYSRNALNKNGVLILLAECGDGIGNKTFLNWFEHKDLYEFETALRKNFEVNGQTAYSTLIKAKDYKIILVSSLPEKTVEKMSMIPASGIKEALDIAFSITGEKPSTYIIPHGTKALPYQI
ncbi:MAG: hypothetical protein A2043_04225 [Candidatus Schekmanbacteria bacterium GWA2_38_9]|uniref:Uncharacterized protein n=1 Tax=Candidatus Schekmanbacteria bacterium RIFCSPLOWO2_12_FULL_38_15 TaxID=1817883 RepID=A0A1F7SH47_9BACT|nr:MAG: hypothetical protein A2043_04225 [Candidatus Schekmanbacteria bacterium GWA2_38_9]OGL48588.1 MAG: hypothetical protein A3H37_05850 [Candidatus Schekmanbacteria bacterium RIFCSPLOWO2_02_FULL_38_14]OGL52568.1 MAG: hypothetical protein A3G31_11410 [Candidatus Schekmanbacteria bacterium RIFCSPLOWO2_12_FULL_38_15]